MHDIAIAFLCNEFFGCFGFSACVNEWSWFRERLGLQNGIFYPIVFSLIRESIFFPKVIHYMQPFAGARVAVVMLLKMYSILPVFLLVL